MMLTVEIWPIDKITPYDKNAKLHHVEWIAKSISEFQIDQPIVVDGQGVIIKGHGRLKAAKSLGLTEFPVIVRTDLTPEQIRLARIADNRSAEGGWDSALLGEELNALLSSMPDYDFDALGLSEDWFSSLDIDTNEITPENDNHYSKKIAAPIYTPNNEKPALDVLFDDSKTKELIEEINRADIPKEEKRFLIEAARRHTVFNFHHIADYYAHSEKPVQELMEKSALVIIDFDKAIENGYVKLSQDIADQYLKENPDND